MGMKTGLKTYSHLYGQNIFPDDYRIVTERILYTQGPEYAIKHPVADWYLKYQALGEILRDDGFDDPARLTYLTYVTQQNEEIIHLERLELLWADEFAKAQKDQTSLHPLVKSLVPLKYVFHTMQLTASYLGKMAPTGKIVTMHLFQAADAMKGVELVERLQQLFSPKAMTDAYQAWMENEAITPWRRFSENLLTTYLWSECYITLHFAYRPLVQNYIKTIVVPLAEDKNCGSIARALLSLLRDMDRHQQGADALRDYIWQKNSELKPQWCKLIEAKQAEMAPILPFVLKYIEG